MIARRPARGFCNGDLLRTRQPSALLVRAWFRLPAFVGGMPYFSLPPFFSSSSPLPFFSSFGGCLPSRSGLFPGCFPSAPGVFPCGSSLCGCP